MTGKLESRRLLAIKIKERDFRKHNQSTRAHQIRVKVDFREEPPITHRSWGNRESSRHNFELRQVFQDRGCRRGLDATPNLRSHYLQCTYTSVPQIATLHVCVSVQKMQPSTPPCSVTKDMLPAGVAVTDSEERSNMGYAYKVY